MNEDGKVIAKKISDLADEIETYRNNKKKIVEGMKKLDADLAAKKISPEDYEKGKNKFLGPQSLQEVVKMHDNYVIQLFDAINKEADKAEMIYKVSDLEPKSKENLVVKKSKLMKIGKERKLQFMKDVNIDRDFLELYMRRRAKKKTTDVRVEYELYKPTEFGKYANKLFENLTLKLTKDYPQYFDPLYKSLRMSGMKVLSKTYISMIILVGLMTFVGVTLFASVVLKHPVLPIQLARGFMLGLVGGMVGMVVAFFYPQSIAKQRDKAINNDLPFVIIHMAAVSGSGAKPISMFKTILSSGEYPGLRDEVKKIVNYVTLFGYDLSTALKAVARRTPSVRFKDMLDGIVSNIESGGDLKEYLQAMADEALSTYRLERKKQVGQIATYADIYTAILIAAPLLFFVTLVIIQKLGGTIGGLPVGTIAKVGTFGVIPALNVGFLVFLSVVSPQ